METAARKRRSPRCDRGLVLESEQLELPFDDAPADVQDGIINIYAVVDDTMAPHPEWQECRVDNNVGVSGGKCLVAN